MATTGLATRMTIGAVARAAGVGVETVRYYERAGLLAPPPRSAAGYRRYGPDAVRRIAGLKRAQRLGFTLAESADLLALAEAPAPCAEVEHRARAKVAQIEEKIAALAAVQDTLLGLVASCEAACGDGCAVLAGLDDATGDER